MTNLKESKVLIRKSYTIQLMILTSSLRLKEKKLIELHERLKTMTAKVIDILLRKEANSTLEITIIRMKKINILHSLAVR